MNNDDLSHRKVNRRTTLAATAIAASSAGCLSRLPFVGGSDSAGESSDDDHGDDAGEGTPEESDDGDDFSDVDGEDPEPDDENGDDEEGQDDGEEEAEDSQGDVTLTGFENIQYGYAIEYPESWRLDRDDLSSVEAWHPDGEGFLRVTAHVAEEEIDAEEVLEEFIANAEADLDDVDEQDREDVEIASDHDATALSLWYDAGGDEYVSENVVATIGRLTYHAEVAVLKDVADEVTEEIVSEALESFAVDSAPSEAVTADELAEHETFEAEEGYSVDHPAEWEHEEVGKGHIRFDSPDAEAGLSVRVVDDSDYPLEMWVENHLEDLEVNPDVTLVDEAETTIASGEEAVLLDVEAENPELGEQIIARELVTVGDGFAAFVALHVPALSFTDNVGSEANDLVTSIEF
jgi:hypothetical protein